MVVGEYIKFTTLTEGENVRIFSGIETEKYGSLRDT